MILRAVILAILLFASATAAWAKTFALVVGINEYKYVPNLDGAVNDALDIAQAFRTAGIDDVKVLLNQDATRANLTDEWQGLVRRAEPGDTLIFTYAGHGSQEPEKVPNSESDGMDEVLILHGFRKEKPGNADRLVDDELNRWFAEADHLNIIFVADACYSGTLTRGIDPRAPKMMTRIISYDPIVEDELPPPDPEAARLAGNDLTHVTFFSAVADDELTTEILIEGKPRGALSWAFARAMRGRADNNEDGKLTKDELEDYIVENILTITERRQHPQVLPSGFGMRTLLEVPPDEMAPFIDPYKSRLRIVGVKRQEASFLRLLLGDVIAVDDAGPPDLVWDVKRSVVVSAVGDVVARLQDMQTSVMRGIVGKWNLLATVRALSERSNLRLQLHPGDGVHAEGTPLRFTMDRHEYRFLTLFNLASDGTVNYIFPNNADSIVDKQSSLEIRTDQRYQLKLEATEPFGADHLVTVVSDVPLLKLHEILRFADGKLAAPLLRTALLTSVKDINYQMGVLGFYTGPVD